MLNQLPEFTSQWRGGAFSDGEYAAVYFLTWQIERFGPQCASKKLKHQSRPHPEQWLITLKECPQNETNGLLSEWLASYQFKGVIPKVTGALCAWLSNEWDLLLCENIPAPRQVLSLQASQVRPVTVISDFPRLLNPVLHKTDAFQFMIHDLEHAWNFRYNAELFQGQVQFFGKLQMLLENHDLDSYLADPVFSEKLDYLMSDMNTHPEHSRQYLRAILIDLKLRREGKLPHESLSPEAVEAINGLLDLAGFSAMAF